MTNKNAHKQTFLNTHRDLFVCLFLLIATLAVYWQVRNHSFVNLDDNLYVTENHHVRAGLTLESITWSFTAIISANWHPLTLLSHMLDCQLFGVDPGRHHQTNLLFHIANTLLLFLVLRRMTGHLWRSAFVAALFALHPLHVESVAWVAERKDVLSTFFWILTMWGYLWYVNRPGVTRYLLALLFFILGLMSKPMLVTLPFVLLLLDYWPLRRLQFAPPGDYPTTPQEYRASRLVLEKIPFFLLAAASSVVTFLVQQRGEAVAALDALSLNVRIANALVSYISYLGKMFWPSHLAVFYPHPLTVPWWHVVGACFLLISISLLALTTVRRRPYLAIGWLWYIGTLVPVIGLVQVGAQAMADRYTYVPLIGLFIIVAWGVPELAAGWRHRDKILAPLAVVLISILMVTTWLQVRHWTNSITLFEHALDVTANNYMAHNNLGATLAKQGRISEAIDHYSDALRIFPGYVIAHDNLGLELVKQGRIAEAIRHFSEALRLDPGFAKAHNNLGATLAEQGRIAEAIVHLQKALRIRPDFVEAHNNLKKALAIQRRIDAPIRKTQEALKLNPGDPALHHRLGNLYKGKGELDQAIVHYKKALSIQPRFIGALNNLAIVFATKGEYHKAISSFKKIIEVRPDSATPHYNIACLYAKQSKIEESIHWLKKAINNHYDNWDLIKTDKDLDNIRGSSNYKALIRGH